MRYNVEYQRNIAYAFLELKREGVEFSSFFKIDEPVIIYGFDFLGKEIFHEIQNKVNIVCMIDREHDGEFYENVPLYSLDNAELKKRTTQYSAIKLLVAIVSDEDRIVCDTASIIPQVRYISLYETFSCLKIRHNLKFAMEQNDNTMQMLRYAIEDKRIDISAIVVVGTTYSMLLAMLYLKDWKNALYIMERFIPSTVAERMKKQGLFCLYERTSVEYYDICYTLADLAKKGNIPVYGQDHIRISRAFWKNSMNVIEDGLMNYDHQYVLRHMNFMDDGNIYLPGGFNDRVKHVLLTGLDKIPQQLEDKVELIDPKQLWKEKNVEARRIIARVMGFDYEEVRRLIKEGRDIVLLTEPIIIAGEHVQTEEGQKKIFSNILSNYDKKRIMIKPHPGDNIDYTDAFSECYILDRFFPVQMIDWMDLGIKRFIIIETTEKTSCRNIFKGKYEVDLYYYDKLMDE